MRHFAFTFLVLLSAAILPRETTASSLAERLYLNFLPPNAAARAATPPSIVTAETPIVVRYTLIGAIAIYEPQAACEPRALSFFGVRDHINPAWCRSRDDNAVVQAFTLHRALSREFPEEAEGFARFLRDLGLEPVSNSTNRSTRNGWANFAGDRIARFFARDGWNSLGDRSNGFRQQFADFTNYRPINCATDDPRNLRRPLRWQPMIQPVDGRGRFSSQIHVVPHIGQTVRPLVLTDQEVRNRRVRSPYNRPNRKVALGRGDALIVQGFLRQTIQISNSLSAGRRFLARWWDNKLLSTASISAFYEMALGLSRFQIAQQFMGEMMSQHDALLVAWREKRRHDLARPRTFLLNLRRGQRFRAFLDERRGFGEVRTEDWRPLIMEQPHSEYPSGSAALCTAAMEHIFLYARARLNGTRVVPPIKIRFPRGSLPFFMSADRTVSFRNPAQAAVSCGRSRLWAGVHFRPAVEAGSRIGRNVGKRVFDHITLLGRGIRPQGCRYCL